MECRQAAAEHGIAASTRDEGFGPHRRIAAYDGRNRRGGGQCVAAGHGGLARGGRGGGRCFATGHGGRASRSSRGCRCGCPAGDALEHAEVVDDGEWGAVTAGGCCRPTRRGTLGTKIAAAGDSGLPRSVSSCRRLRFVSRQAREFYSWSISPFVLIKAPPCRCCDKPGLTQGADRLGSIPLGLVSILVDKRCELPTVH